MTTQIQTQAQIQEASGVQLLANARDFFSSSRWLLACVTIMRMASWETTKEPFSQRRAIIWVLTGSLRPARPVCTDSPG